MSNVSLNALNEQFTLPDAVRFETGRGSLLRAVISGANATGEVYLHGAHVTDFTPTGQHPVLFVSSAAHYQDGLPIRGGVPIWFPWFAAKADDPAAPGHGLVRTRSWEVTNTLVDGQAVTIELATTLPPFVLTYRISFGSSLVMRLAVTNTSENGATFEQALHSYFRIKDIAQVTVSGLGGTRYFSKVSGGEFADEQPQIRFTGETDRIYHDTQATCLVNDPGWERRIRVAKENSNSTVVWNPWIDKAARMEDFGNNEWPQMLCMETANVGPSAVTLPSRQTHQMTATICVEPL